MEPRNRTGERSQDFIGGFQPLYAFAGANARGKGARAIGGGVARRATREARDERALSGRHAHESLERDIERSPNWFSQDEYYTTWRERARDGERVGDGYERARERDGDAAVANARAGSRDVCARDVPLERMRMEKYESTTLREIANDRAHGYLPSSQAWAGSSQRVDREAARGSTPPMDASAPYAALAALANRSSQEGVNTLLGSYDDVNASPAVLASNANASPAAFERVARRAIERAHEKVEKLDYKHDAFASEMARMKSMLMDIMTTQANILAMLARSRAHADDAPFLASTRLRPTDDSARAPDHPSQRAAAPALAPLTPANVDGLVVHDAADARTRSRDDCADECERGVDASSDREIDETELRAAVLRRMLDFQRHQRTDRRSSHSSSM